MEARKTVEGECLFFKLIVTLKAKKVPTCKESKIRNYPVQNSPPQHANLSRINPVYFHFNNILSSTPNSLFFSDERLQLCTYQFVIHSMRSVCPASLYKTQ